MTRKGAPHSSSNGRRLRSSSIVVPSVVLQDEKRQHSVSVSLVDIDDPRGAIDIEDNYRGKIQIFDNADLEKQLILSAGGRNQVLMFCAKLVLLTVVVLACGVLIFYAL